MGTIIFLVMLGVILVYVDYDKLPSIVKILVGLAVIIGSAMFLNPK